MSLPIHCSLAFLGAGRMANALIRGFLDSELMQPDHITVSSKSGTSSTALAREYGIIAAPDNQTAIAAATIVFLCTKPAQALSTLSENTEALQGKLLISVAAGISADHLWAAAGRDARVIRTMPNTGVRIHKGATTIAPHASATTDDLALVKKLFSSVGTAYEIKESQIDATTAVSGSGPAFALLFLEGMLQGGIQEGLDPTLARALAAHAVEAAAALVLETDDTPTALRAEIASPKGTTEAGLNVLQDASLSSITQAAIHAAVERAKQLALLVPSS